MKGVPLNSYLDRETVEECIFKHFGKTSFIAKDLDVTPRAMQRYFEEHDLWPLVEKAQDLEEDEIDDLSITAVQKLVQKLNDEPSIALNAAFKALTRSGSKRKKWALKATGNSETAQFDQQEKSVKQKLPEDKYESEPQAT